MSAAPHRHRLSCSRQIDMVERERVRHTGDESFAMQFGKASMQTRATIQKSGMVKFAGDHSGSIHPASGIFVARNAISHMWREIPERRRKPPRANGGSTASTIANSAGKFRG
jgi:hypothetical protein